MPCGRCGLDGHKATSIEKCPRAIYDKKVSDALDELLKALGEAVEAKTKAKAPAPAPAPASSSTSTPKKDKDDEESITFTGTVNLPKKK